MKITVEGQDGRSREYITDAAIIFTIHRAGIAVIAEIEGVSATLPLRFTDAFCDVMDVLLKQMQHEEGYSIIREMVKKDLEIYIGCLARNILFKEVLDQNERHEYVNRDLSQEFIDKNLDELRSD